METTTEVANLFTPIDVGPLSLKNRIAMAPMTRSRAMLDGTPTAMMADYYAQRAGAGLIVSEGVNISAEAQGFIHVPGIFTDAHTSAWRKVTERVHAQNSTFVMQLWHTGRIGHPDNMGSGLHPVAPSALAHDRTVVTPSGLQPAPVPREMTDQDILRTIDDYAQAARRAIAAGCDGVEIHAANGYLPGQFLHESTNLREDAWGGDLKRRARFLIDSARACAEAVGSHRVAVRITPFSVFNGARSADDSAVYRYLLPALGELGLLYLHVVTAEVAGNQTVVRTDGDDLRDVVGFTRALWPGILMAAGGYDRKKADEEIRSGRADIVAFGRDFIGNPDLPERLAKGHPLAERRPADWYGAAETGYTDYPAFDPLQ
ncbi:MAG: alkene reductase [Beijerinckiaceae bacterium]|nr:alkene reductase [Beijerinckiaceae bacterium]